ncbi:MAG: hypothetical protein ACKOBZ_02170 [Nitrospira sp.]|nr:hypothetical protein [Nitrospira sp.]
MDRVYGEEPVTLPGGTGAEQLAGQCCYALGHAICLGLAAPVLRYAGLAEAALRLDPAAGLLVMLTIREHRRRG